MSIQDLERSLDYAKKVRADVDSAIRGIEYLIARERATDQVKSKPYREMTDDELATELQTLETKQSQATGWGAAVGVRGEYIDEIKREQRRRRELRAEDTFGGLRPREERCKRCGKSFANGEMRWSDGTINVYHYGCKEQRDAAK